MQRFGKTRLRGHARVGASILGQTVGNALAYQISQGSNTAAQGQQAPKAGATYEQNLAAHGFTFGDGGLTATPTDNTMYAPDPSLAGAQPGDIVVTATRIPTYVDGYLLPSNLFYDVNVFQSARANGRTPSPMSAQGLTWLKEIEVNSLTMNPQLARQYGDQSFDPASGTYLDSQGNLTFGYGHVITSADQSNGLTIANLSNSTLETKQMLAEYLFSRDATNAYNQVVDKLGADTVNLLAPNQVDALIATVFNGGGNSALGPTMEQHIWDGNYGAVAQDFNAWNANGHVVGGLVTRNILESSIWSNGTYSISLSPQQQAIKTIIMKTGSYP